jgi:hypothetical protein
MSVISFWPFLCCLRASPHGGRAETEDLDAAAAVADPGSIVGGRISRTSREGSHDAPDVDVNCLERTTAVM